MKEVWRDVVGYEGLYEVSNMGRVNSFPKLNNKNPVYHSKRELKLVKNGDGYYRVSLSRDGCDKRVFVHKLVAQAFIKNPENKPQVNHKDSNIKNNTVGNLEWCTHSENMKHGYKYGNKKRMLGQNNFSSKLRTEEVTKIRTLYSEGVVQTELSKMFGVTQANISLIVRRDHWKHI